MRRVALFLVLGLVALPLSGCQHGIIVTSLGPPGVNYEPVPPDSVFQFLGKDRVLVPYEPIARLHYDNDLTFSGAAAQRTAEEEILATAGELGAHGIIRTARTEATVIRFTHGAALQAQADMSAVKAAVDPAIVPPLRADPVRRVPTGPEPWLHAVRTHAEVRTLGVASLAIPQDLPVPDSVLAVCTDELFLELQAAGFDVFPLDGAGSDDLDLDAVLYPDIVPVEAHFYGERAEWDGASRKVGETRSTAASVFSGILTAIVQGERDQDDFEHFDNTPEGWVWGISLVVTMENSIGANIYTGRGGIELLEKADFEGGIYIGDPGPEEYEVEDVTEDELFTRTGRWRRAVGLALEGLSISFRLPEPGRS